MELWVSLLSAGVGPDGLQGPSQLQPFYESMILRERGKALLNGISHFKAMFGGQIWLCLWMLWGLQMVQL